jgi:ferric-dicitrate binding protein FerR (iron transport regulator)
MLHRPVIVGVRYNLVQAPSCPLRPHLASAQASRKAASWYATATKWRCNAAMGRPFRRWCAAAAAATAAATPLSYARKPWRPLWERAIVLLPASDRAGSLDASPEGEQQEK